MKVMKKKVGKILLSLTMVFAMVLTIMPTNVFATESSNIIGDEIAVGDTLYAGDIIFDKEMTGTTYPFNTIYYNDIDGTTELKNYYAVQEPYTIEKINEFTIWEVIKVVDSYSNNQYIILKAAGSDVKVNGGVSDSTSNLHGANVTITANVPASGKQFKEWTVVSGDVTLADATNATTTFTMPNKAVEVTATYEDVVIPPTPNKPTITVSGGFNYQISAGKDMTLTCSGKLEDLAGIYVDGNLVDPSNYTLKSGSTILTLKASYLDTLSAGKHTLKFQYKDNVSAETEFTITEKSETTKPSSPQTGDTANTMPYFGLIALSGCALIFGLKKKKTINNLNS